MKNITALIVLVLCALTSFGQRVDLDKFTKLDASSGYFITLVKSDKHMVDVEMTEGEFEDLAIEVRNKTLHIKTKKGFFNSGKTKANIELHYTTLNDIDASAGVKIISQETLPTRSLDVDASSGANVLLNVDTEDLNVDVSSGARLEIRGKTLNQNIDLSSGARYEAEELESRNASADASSGASGSIWCTEKLVADASSGGNITYKGSPREKNIDVGKWSGGSVSPR